MNFNKGYLENLAAGNCQVPVTAIRIGGGGGGGRGPTGPTGPGGGATGPTGATGLSGNAPNFQATATGDITTSSVTDVVATGMTLTPPAGTYLVWFSGVFSTENSNAEETLYASIYYNGTKVDSSESSCLTGKSNGNMPFISIAKVTVNGSQAIEGKWRTTDGAGDTATMHQRNITALQVAP